MVPRKPAKGKKKKSKRAKTSRFRNLSYWPTKRANRSAMLVWFANINPDTLCVCGKYGDLRERATCTIITVTTEEEKAKNSKKRRKRSHLNTGGSPGDEVCQLTFTNSLQALMNLLTVRTKITKSRQKGSHNKLIRIDEPELDRHRPE